MKNTTIKLRIHYATGEQIIDLDYIPLESTYVNCTLLMQQFKNGCLIERNHKFLQTQFDLTGAGPCRIMEFNDRKEFVTIKVCANTSGAPMAYLISEPYVIILKESSILLSQPICSMVIIDHT